MKSFGVLLLNAIFFLPVLFIKYVINPIIYWIKRKGRN